MFTGLISFVDDGNLGEEEVSDSGRIKDPRCITDLVWIFERPAIYAVIGRVKSALGEPGDITRLESTRSDGLERSIPVESLAGGLR
jgi:hypothetical protein